MEATLQPPGWHSTALTTSQRSPLMFNLVTSLVAAQPGGQGKGEVMLGLDVRPSILLFICSWA